MWIVKINFDRILGKSKYHINNININYNNSQ